MMRHRGPGPILVVEDDPALREALTLILEREGHTVVAAAEGQKALDILRGPSRPSLVLLDLMLPVMDGFEFRVQQRQDPRVADVPVIVLSAGGDLERKTAGMTAAACLHKPIDIDELLGLIARLRN